MLTPEEIEKIRKGPTPEEKIEMERKRKIYLRQAKASQTITIVPASVGFNVIEKLSDEPSIAFRTPILAWQIVTEWEDEICRWMSHAMPITPDGDATEGEYWIECPDRQILTFLGHRFESAEALEKDWQREADAKQATLANPRIV